MSQAVSNSNELEKSSQF